MKLPKCLFYFLITFAIISCSDDDNVDSEESISNHFPLTVGNSWTYNNKTTYQDGTSTTAEETLTVESTFEEQGVTYYNLESDASSINEEGFFTGILTTGNLIMADNQLIYNGELTVDVSNFGLDLENLSIPLNNIIIFDAEANSGDLLTEADNVISQSIDFQENLVPFTIVYSLHTVQNDFLNSYTVNEEEFQDVLSAGIVVNLEIMVGETPFIFTILESQDAIQINNYYADNVGLIKSETSINYDFEELPFPNIPSIPDFSMEETQEINRFVVAE